MFGYVCVFGVKTVINNFAVPGGRSATHTLLYFNLLYFTLWHSRGDYGCSRGENDYFGRKNTAPGFVIAQKKRSDRSAGG